MRPLSTTCSEQPLPIDADLLPELRALAGRLDPLHARDYAAMSHADWQKGAETSAHLLLEHRLHLFRQHTGRGDPRTHRRAVNGVLQTLAESDLVAGLCVLVIAARILSDEPRAGA
jgi:hypothetical protein